MMLLLGRRYAHHSWFELVPGVKSPMSAISNEVHKLHLFGGGSHHHTH